MIVEGVTTQRIRVCGMKRSSDSELSIPLKHRVSLLFSITTAREDGEDDKDIEGECDFFATYPTQRTTARNLVLLSSNQNWKDRFSSSMIPLN